MRNLKLYITFLLFYLFLTIEIWMTMAVRFIMADHFDLLFLIWMGVVIIGLISVPVPKTIDTFFNNLRRKFVRRRLIKYIAKSGMMTTTHIIRKWFDKGWYAYENWLD